MCILWLNRVWQGHQTGGKGGQEFQGPEHLGGLWLSGRGPKSFCPPPLLRGLESGYTPLQCGTFDIPELISSKLLQLSISPAICQWIYSFLTGRTQQEVERLELWYVQHKDLELNTLKTEMIMANDTTVISLIKDGDKSAYRQEVEQLELWCGQHKDLELNTLKTEIIMDHHYSCPSRCPTALCQPWCHELPCSSTVGAWVALCALLCSLCPLPSLFPAPSSAAQLSPISPLYPLHLSLPDPGKPCQSIAASPALQRLPSLQCFLRVPLQVNSYCHAAKPAVCLRHRLPPIPCLHNSPAHLKDHLHFPFSINCSSQPLSHRLLLGPVSIRS
ncbi:uncharacterized protein LOC133480634 [Phyllopteryx taeniolatus]|uniref:uncharacterized protein LOC133480634 n=1 Tax=Phyllopteryx taeniolatus TaxID=161469 RepID=UPI002AD263AE|nr:uncharacterized protein LOC133480634 [Phyllopteryx taeniolatus]